MSRTTALGFLILGIAAAGCSDSDSGGGGGSAGDLEWPPSATVYFDEHRVFNGDCETDEDCAMALGYYHAFDRFVQMDIRRRFSTGRLADILPKDLAGLLSNDFADLRAVFSTRQGQPTEDFLYEQASEKTKRLLDAYAVGVNQWIADMKAGENGATFPREFTARALEYDPQRVPEWTPQDSVAAIVALIENLTNNESDQVNAEQARQAIGDDAKFSDLWSRRPLEESAILPLDWTPPEPPSEASPKRGGPPLLTGLPLRERLDVEPVTRRLAAKLDRVLDLRRMILGPGLVDEIGSNNWVVGPSLTVDGNALLSNDPHLGMTQPATWYLAHLDAVTNGVGEIHSAGVTFAGLPWVLVGHNERIAWGLTTTDMDFSDVYFEELTPDGDGVMFNGEEIPFLRKTFTLTFSDGTTEDTELLFVPHHGPVREIDLENGTAVTLRWTGNDLDTDINFLTDLVRAGDIEEAKAALTNITSIGQNVVIMDSENNIGWFPYNRLPKCTWATGLDGGAPRWLPLDGTGAFEWTEYFALEELPQAQNPESGYVATANNDMTGALFDGDPTTLPSGMPIAPYQSSAVAGFRHAQIVNLIEEVGDQHTRETMDAIVSDIYSLIGQRMVPGILAIANDAQTTPGADGQKVIDALESWDFNCPTGLDGTDSQSSPLTEDDDELLAASGCAAFHAMFIELRGRIEANEHAPTDRRPSNAMYYSIVDPSQLNVENKDIYWDDPGTPAVETKFEVMSEVLQTVGEFLILELGANEKEWAWGRLHGLELESDLSTFGIFAYNNPPPGEPLFANDGGLFTIDVANPLQQPGRDFVQTAGASTRFVCEASPEGPSCTIQLPGGQSGDIDSPYYEDLLLPYLRNEPMPLVFDIAEAAQNAASTVTFD